MKKYSRNFAELVLILPFLAHAGCSSKSNPVFPPKPKEIPSTIDQTDITVEKAGPPNSRELEDAIKKALQNK